MRGIEYEVNKLYEFEASHQLSVSCASAECERMHGHSYKVRIGIASRELNNEEMVLNFNELDTIVKPVIDSMDHRHLVPMTNSHEAEYAQVQGLEEYKLSNAAVNTTAERMAEFFVTLVHHQLGGRIRLTRIWATVNETRKCQARAELVIEQ